jgi:hypothetical protein
MSLRTLAERVDVRSDAIYLDETEVYLTHHNSRVFRVPRSGGAPVALPFECVGGNLVADAREIWVVDVASSCISRWTKGAEAASVIASRVRLSGMGLLTREHLWVTTESAIARVARSGGPVETMLEASEPELLGADATSVYFTVGGFFAETNRAGALPIAGGRPRELPIAPFIPGCARFVDDAIYVLGARGELSATSTTDGARRELRVIPLDGRPFLTMNRRWVYVGDHTRVPVAGGPAERLDLDENAVVHSATVDERGLTLLYDDPRGRTLASWE